jgi:hypothetical protein
MSILDRIKAVKYMISPDQQLMYRQCMNVTMRNLDTFTSQTMKTNIHTEYESKNMSWIMPGCYFVLGDIIDKFNHENKHNVHCEVLNNGTHRVVRFRLR